MPSIVLERLSGSGFRCFSDVTLDLEPDTTVLVGPNGSGKTALLDLLALGLVPLLQPGRSRGLAGREGATASCADLGLDLAAGDLRNPGGVVRTAATVRMPDPGALAQTWRTTWDAGWAAPVEEARGAHEGAAAALPVVAYYRERRRLATPDDVPDAPSEGAAPAPALDAARGSVGAQAWFFGLENEELRLGRACGDFGLQLPVLEAVRRILGGLVEAPARFSSEPGSGRLRMRRGTSWLELAQLGAGLGGLLSLALDFAWRLTAAHPELENPLSAPGLLLIDGVDQDLDPQRQATVVARLRSAFPSTQIVATTRNPVVACDLQGRQIRMLDAQHRVARGSPDGHGEGERSEGQ